MTPAITWTNNNPSTIHNTLKRKLGREPTHNELTAEVWRIIQEARDERS